MKNLARYRKFAVSAAGFLVVLGGVLADGNLSADEITPLVTAFLVAIGVVLAPNAPKVPTA